MERLLYLYLASGIFGAGVTLVLFFTSAFGAVTDGTADGENDIADGETMADSTADTADDGSIDDDGGEEFTADDDMYEHSPSGSYVLDYNRHRGNTILYIMGKLRTLVFFCAGFGTVGTFAILTGESPLSSIIWSIPVGVVTVLIFQFFKNLQQKSLDSSFSDQELVNLQGSALLPLSDGSPGKVRISFGRLEVVRYANVHKPDVTIEKGDRIRVVRVDDDFVYVDKM
ncbi:MAG: hypothetical protein ACOC2H_08950 [Spirochaetota bacterium]